MDIESETYPTKECQCKSVEKGNELIVVMVCMYKDCVILFYIMNNVLKITLL